MPDEVKGIKYIKCPVLQRKRSPTTPQVPLGGNLTHLLHCASCGTTYPIGTEHPKKTQGPFIVRYLKSDV